MSALVVAGVRAAEMPSSLQGAEVVEEPTSAPPEAGVAEAGEGPSPEAAAEEEPAPRLGDWELDCAGDPCVLLTRILAADGTEVLRIEAGGRPDVLRFATPLGLHLPDGLVAAIGEEGETHIPWRTCAPEHGCVAEAPLDPALLAALRRERAGTAAFTLVEGVPVRLGFSLMGFSAGWRAREAAGAP